MSNKSKLPFDPNIKSFVDAINAADNGAKVIMKYAHLKPSKIKSDTVKKYCAKFKDDFGSYWFEITKKQGVFSVKSDGHLVHTGSDIKHIVWNFETQLASYLPKVLKLTH